MQTAYLDTFLKTVESRSFTLAAKQLFITQQAVSKQVACLEKELQATLVERTTPLRLTPKGRIVARYAGAMLQLLQDMQRQKIHLAVVMDEYGGLAGVVTVEDLLEEIVGNIYDEFDPAEPPELEQIGEDMWRVSGALGVEELGETLGIEFPEDADFDTVGGMVLSCLRTIPKDGSQPSVQVNGLDIQVEKVADHRIQSALVRRAVT